MGKTFLVARREYLAYITAWGFWVGLLITPVALLLGITIPELIQNSQPARYYAVVDEVGSDFETELEAYFAGRQERVVRDLLEQSSRFDGDEAAEARLERYDNLLNEGLTPGEALEDLLPGSSTALPDQDFIAVPPPARSLEALTPYLQGEVTVEGPLGERPLFAVFFVRDGELAYWSEDVVNDSLSDAARRVLERMSRADVFREAGVSPDILERAAENVATLTLHSPSAEDLDSEVSFADRAPFFFATGFSFLLWLLIFSVVNYLLTGTIEERSNKIFDTLLTSVNLPQLLAGKLFGVFMLSLTLMGIWASSAIIMAFVMRDAIPPDIAAGFAELTNPGLIVPTLISFFLGYLMFGAIFLALGSLCDTIQEAQSLLSPIIIVMIIPFLMIPVTLSNPDSSLLGILAWLPLLSPFLIILRVPTEPPLWELIIQMTWMGVVTLLILWGAARVYRAGVIHGAGVNEVRRWFTGLFSRA
tara:strand:- start:24303 stop:25730 length:1428 start_codon:yes stop_codon:yes gene_type:complete